jgi:hypothetical protein
MATFPRFNGDSQPVFNLDVNNGSQTGNITVAATVQPQGPKLNFFKLIVRDGSNTAVDLRGQLGSYTSGVFYPGVINAINQAIQQTTTIAIYQVEADTSGQISYAIYNNEAFPTATDLGNVVAALGNVQVVSSDGTVTGVNVSGSISSSAGFKLA